MSRLDLKFWLVRLPMTFLLIGCFLVWEIYKSTTGRAPMLPAWRLTLYMLAAGACGALFVMGMKERHRRQ